MRINENGDSLKGMIAAMRRIREQAEDRIVVEMEAELERAFTDVHSRIHVHTGNLKQTFVSDSERTPGHWQGSMGADDPDAARAAHWEKEKGIDENGDHDFMRPVEDGTYFGERLEEKIADIFDDLS